MAKLTMRKHIFICFIALLLCVTVSYSWILDSEKSPATNIILDLQGKVGGRDLKIVSDTGYSIEIYKYLDAETTVLVSSENSLTIDGMVPGESLRFKIRLRNTTSSGTDSVGFVRLYMTGVTCSYNGDGVCENPDAILDSLYLFVNAGDGYYNTDNVNLEKPEHIFSPLSALQAYDEGSTLIIYKELAVPYTPGKDDYVELECRLWLDSEAEDIENISLSFGNFVLSI